MPTLWIKHEGDAKDLPGLMAKANVQGLPQRVQSEIVQGKFMVVPNTLDNRRGYFVVFGEDRPSGVRRAVDWVIVIALALLIWWLVAGG